MILPYLAEIIAGMKAFVHRNAPFRLTFITWSHSSSLISESSPKWDTPALLTRILGTRPRDSSFSFIRSTCSALRISADRVMALAPREIQCRATRLADSWDSE
ncbi:hypothetical protein D3C75_882570 [compost metagenome]